MNKELSDRAWACLPREFKEEVKKYYQHTDCGSYAEDILESIFGEHNLTSDAEGEEMLTCEKQRVQQQYKRANQLKDDSGPKWELVGDQIERVLSGLFGSKCLPDEASPKEATSAESATPPTPAEPKNKDSELLYPESVENLRISGEKSHSRHNSPKNKNCDNHLADVSNMMDGPNPAASVEGGMRIYISLPISGKNLATQQILAAQTAEKIRTLGHLPVNPFDTPLAQPEMSEREKYAYYMGEDIKRLLLCDAAYFHPHWTKSKGCRIEHHAAVTCGLETFYTFSDMMPIDEIMPKVK